MAIDAVSIHRSAVLLLASASINACATDGSGTTVTRTDSSGVRIVVSAAATWLPDEAWRLEGPVLSIGSVDGPEESQLHRVRAARRLPDGRIVVANGGSMDLRLFTPDGQWIRSIGRAGDGPGEFRLISALQVVPPDTILVFDNSAPRVTSFTADGNLAWSRRVATPGENVQAPDHRLADGRWLNRLRTTEVDGFQRVRNLFGAWSEGESRIDTLLESDGQEYLIYRRFQGSQYIGRGPVVTPFGGQDLAAIGPNLFALSDGKSYDVAVAEVGSGQMRIRRPHNDRPLPDGAVSRFIDDYVARYPPERQREVRGHFATLTTPSQVPAHSALAFDEGGNLWAENFRFPWDSLATRTWAVYARAGEWLGDVEVPRGLRVLQFGADFVLGVERDENDVEFVRMYRIVKPG